MVKFALFALSCLAMTEILLATKNPRPIKDDYDHDDDDDDVDSPVAIESLLKTVPASSVQCMPASLRSLKKQLKSYGGVAGNMMATSKAAAKRNWRKQVAMNRGNAGYSRSYSNRTPRINTCLHALKKIQRRRKVHRRWGYTQKKHARKVLAGNFRNSCIRRGSVTPRGTLSLCTTCTSQTILPADRYPRYITEQKCLVSDRGCFQGEGLCTDTFVTQIILKKTQNCVLSKNGIYLEEWKPTYYRIRVGCACELRRNTFLTAFI